MRLLTLLLAATVLVAGCARTWKTDYSDTIDPAVSRSWRVSQVNVTVPRTLTISEENSYTPEADIVWREDPLTAGTDRYQQVDAIMTNAARRGASGLRGGRAVRLDIVVQEFHAVTERTRSQLQNSGVHNVVFGAQISDASSGQVLVPTETIHAELPAYAGRQARAAVSRGETQKVRITNHVAATISGWLGTGPDVRGTFQRRGR